MSFEKLPLNTKRHIGSFLDFKSLFKYSACNQELKKLFLFERAMSLIATTTDEKIVKRITDDVRQLNDIEKMYRLFDIAFCFFPKTVKKIEYVSKKLQEFGAVGIFLTFMPIIKCYENNPSLLTMNLIVNPEVGFDYYATLMSIKMIMQNRPDDQQQNLEWLGEYFKDKPEKISFKNRLLFKQKDGKIILNEHTYESIEHLFMKYFPVEAFYACKVLNFEYFEYHTIDFAYKKLQALGYPVQFNDVFKLITWNEESQPNNALGV